MKLTYTGKPWPNAWWRARLKDRDAYRDILFGSAYCKAMAEREQADGRA